MTAARKGGGGIDWNAAAARAAALLRDYIRIDNTNPPGNERAAVDFLARALNDAGIPLTVPARDPARPNLVARLAGSGAKKPLALLHHMDTVEAGTGWSVAPHGGVERDGFIWGRGALDCKSLGVMHLMTMLLLKERGAPLARDLLFIAAADEERGGDFGARWLTEAHPEEVGAEFLLGEGGLGLTAPGRPGIWLPSYAEKGILWLRISAQADGGHASVPKPGGAVGRICRALAAVERMENPVFITEEAEQNLSAFAEKAGPPWSLFLKRPGLRLTRFAVKMAAARNHVARALTCSTVAATSISTPTGGNQLPGSCEATLDCRIHPSDDPGNFLKRLAKAIGDPGVSIEKTLEAPATRSATDTELYRVMSAALARNGTAKMVVPMLSPAGTDARFFRTRGAACYGILPILAGVDDMEPHRADERISLSNLELGCRIMYEIAAEMCARA